MLLGSWGTSRSSDVRPLTSADRDEVLDLCAQDPSANVYVAARILEIDLDRTRGSLLGYYSRGELAAACWVSANVVPVGCDPVAAAALAPRIRRQERHVSSVFGPAEQVGNLWEHLAKWWRPPADLRSHQPLMAIGPIDPVPVAEDPLVRPATMDEAALISPAAAAMFTEEIGYAPYVDRAGQQAYEASVRTLISRGHCFVRIEDGKIVFKADVGSNAVGACQIQGVWVDPSMRGRGIAAPAMATVVRMCRERVAPLVTLYVNDYNRPARAAYQRVGFRDVGMFSTVLL
jgi:uncharacterized protein